MRGGFFSSVGARTTKQEQTHLRIVRHVEGIRKEYLVKLELEKVMSRDPRRWQQHQVGEGVRGL
jgi:hypothetical protein